MLALIQLHSAMLDASAPALSPVQAYLLLLMITAIPLIPYILLHRTWEDAEEEGQPAEQHTHGLGAWLHFHRHPELLHHSH